MTKYIDLLREHEPDKQNKKAKGKGSKKKDGTENPYRAKQDNFDGDTSFLDEVFEEDAAYENGNIEDDNILLDEAISADSAKNVLLNDETEAPESVAQSKVTHPLAPKTAQNDAWIGDMQEILATIFEHAETNNPTDLSPFDKQLNLLFEKISDDCAYVGNLELEIITQNPPALSPSSGTADLVRKSTLMLLYTLKIGLHMKLSMEELHQLVFASMLQHIGMASISPDIRYKQGALNREERNQIQQATAQSVAYLKTCEISNEELLQSIAQIQERCDGTGPKELTGHEISWGARFIALVSTFEALTQPRTYHEQVLPRTAIRTLINEHKKEFDTKIFKGLIEAVTLYPVGTIVQINTGEVGHVTQTHDQFPLRPVVLISMDKYTNPIEARVIDLAKQSNLLIKASMFKEDLPELKAG